MPHLLPITTHSDSTSSGSEFFESDYITSPCSSSGSYCVPPNNNSRLPILTSTVNAETIFSFAWSNSNSGNATSMSETPSTVADQSQVAFTKAFQQSRHKPPPLPAPIFWSALTHADVFNDYIKAKGLKQVWSQDNIDIGKG